MNIAVLGYEDSWGLGFIGAVDFLALSRQILIRRYSSDPFNVVTVSCDGLPFRDSSGRYHNVDASIATLGTCSAVIVPPFLCDSENHVRESPTVGAISDWLRHQHALGSIIAGSCNGVFVLGDAGLLDGRRCTTTWWLHDRLKARYARADVARGTSLIQDGRVITAGGPLSWIDVSLHLIRHLCGSEAAKLAADFAIVDMIRPTQASYVPQNHVAASNPLLLDAEHLVRQAEGRSMTSAQLAKELGVSERTLHRRLKDATGESPKKFIDRLRFEAVQILLKTTRTPVKGLAHVAGYLDETSFRRAFRRHAGMTPGAYRLLSTAWRCKQEIG
jgi:transcriptional regulator GlxA family with amidase domain